MPSKRYNAEESIQELREADVLHEQEKTIAQVCKLLGITDQSYYRWRKQYGGMLVDQARRLKGAARQIRCLRVCRPASLAFDRTEELSSSAGKLMN